MKNNVNCVEYLNASCDLCCGCGSCFNICPCKAITMNSDSHGFLIPKINLTKCNNCGLCRLSCPIYNYNKKKFKNSELNPARYAFYGSDDVLSKSSSGGFFSYISTFIFNQGGFVVGASYSQYFTVKHEILDDIKYLYRLRLSKYIQSDQNDCYFRIKQLLIDNKLVLYSGTPCQIAGLKSYLRQKDYPNLLTLELLCHGVPSHKLLYEYLDSTYGIDNINEINMRKTNGWSTCLDVILKDGRIHNDTIFINAFLKDIILRDCCYSCKFASLPRVGDITIGDCWNARLLKLDKLYQKKSSIILVNNHKGDLFLKQALSLKNDYNLKNISNLDINLLNENIYRPNSHYSKSVNLFWENYKSMDFTSAYIKAMLGKNKNDKLVGLVIYSSNNYGSCATNYALYQKIQNLGYCPVVLDSLVPIWGISKDYFSKNCNMIGNLIDKSSLKIFNEVFTTFVVGSDYSLNIVDMHTRNHLEYLLLAFVNNNNRKIAYAPSLGVPDFEHDESLRFLFKHMLKRFNFLSFREDSAKEHCKKFLQIDSECVLDPVFLMNKDEYSNISNQSKLKIKEKYILVYMLDPTPSKIKLINEYEKQYHLKKYVIVDLANYENSSKFFEKDVLNRLTFQDFIYYFKNSEIIITDSFHGTCFSLIFNKKFISIKNRNAKRFDTLIEMFGKDLDLFPIFNSSEEACSNIIKSFDLDYEYINSSLEKYQKISENYLLNSLSANFKISKEPDSVDINVNYIKLWRENFFYKNQSFYNCLIPYAYIWKEFAQSIKNSLPSYLELSESYSNLYFHIFFKQVNHKVHYEMLLLNKKLFFCIHCEDLNLQTMCKNFFKKIKKIFNLDFFSFNVNIPILDINLIRINDVCLTVMKFIGKLDCEVRESLLPVLSNK